MHRFFLPPAECRDAELQLTDREAHHALHVLRVRRGEHVVVLDGEGHEFLCEIGTAGRHALQLAVVQKNYTPPQSCPITLLQAIPKGKLFEFIVQKATELGTARIVPLLTERVITHLDGQDSAHKAEKWRQAAIEAIKQCGTPWLPQIEPPVTPAQFIARRDFIELPLIASLQGDSRHPRKCFEEFHAVHGRMPKSAAVWIGPEGDFTPAEMELIKSAGAAPITLGPRVLRTETAAMYCLSVMQYELQFQPNK
ncbi:MAG: 16S rRNA (uracil(1498)-N(3))-methyltransferase [Verrucomicrobia bacterium]|nr:16S rRNA (uracil(1498)-N(3))-methyltransferase [Verrucomicrobiota bacterium]